MNNSSTSNHLTASKVFISYSWDNQEVKDAVSQLVNQLKKDGVEVVFDQNDLLPGQDMNDFMLSLKDKTITKVLIICDPTYKMKADARKSGVGKEVGIIQGEVLKNPTQTRIIPVVWDDDFENCLPNFLGDRYGLPFPRGKDIEQKYRKLLETICSNILPQKNSISLNNFSFNYKTSVSRNDREQVSDFFYNRFCRAFPDSDIHPEYSSKKEIRSRLRVLFESPVESDSIWWLSSEGTGEFNSFKCDSNSNREFFIDGGAGCFSCCELTKVVPICSGMTDWTANVYVESALTSAPPQPLLSADSGYMIRFFHKTGRELSGSERNCGCFYEDGICHEFDSSDVIEVTTRPRPFNFLICPKFGPVIQGHRDLEIAEILDAILRHEQTVDDLSEYLLRIPKPQFSFKEYKVSYVSEAAYAWAKPEAISKWLSR
ncbi:MAG: TIR domain-containing protein [Kiritimatiellae bacterium]|nr:TIR domain-containing protein [Kiritimatiellia bacterium]